MSINRRTEELNVVSAYNEYYSAVNRDEILTPVTTQMNLENGKLRGISQTQKDKYCVIPLIRGA